ncbi:MAG: hypothetical protein ISS45_08890 [Candidatus Omnitrophica bacterium]|nr:hypothetical protein [Candidatus Omnitrophota bacterium]
MILSKENNLCNQFLISGIRSFLSGLFLVNPVRELRSLTACADGGFKPPSALSGNDHPDVTSGWLSLTG